MRITLKKDRLINGQIRLGGEEIILPDLIANEFIEKGLAEPPPTPEQKAMWLWEQTMKLGPP